MHTAPGDWHVHVLCTTHRFLLSIKTICYFHYPVQQSVQQSLGVESPEPLSPAFKCRINSSFIIKTKTASTITLFFSSLRLHRVLLPTRPSQHVLLHVYIQPDIYIGAAHALCVWLLNFANISKSDPILSYTPTHCLASSIVTCPPSV